MADANGINGVACRIEYYHAHQELLEVVLQFLHTQLMHHVREEDPNALVRYHATVRIVTRGEN